METEKNINISDEKLHDNYIAPQNGTEEKLVEMWREVLRINKVGVNENFFELGGNSIKALMLNSKIRDEFHKNIPFKMIFKFQTIRKLAKAIEDHADKDVLETDGVTLLNNKCQKSLFAFPPMAGWGLYYSELANAINDVSVYAIDFIEADDRIQQYVKLITHYQKEGPYILLGYSIGGNVAFEVAKEMEKQGYEVSDIIFMDAYVKNKKNKVSDEEIKKKVEDFLEALINLNDFLNWLGKTALKNYSDEQLIYDIAYKKVAVGERYYADMINKGKINANIHLLITDSEKNLIGDLRREWFGLTNSNYEEIKAYGGHLTMLENENLKENAQLLQELLNKCGNKN